MKAKIDPFVFVIIGSVALIIIIVFYLGNLAVKNNIISLPQLSLFSSSSSTAITPNVDALYLAPPITSLSGAKITNKAKDAIWVEVTALPLDYSPSVTPIQYKKITFKVAITDKTAINRNTLIIPYSFKTNTPPAAATAPLNLDSFSIGDIVNINLISDLRVLMGDTVTAANITKIVPPNVLSGLITKTSATTIQITASLSAVAPAILFGPPSTPATPQTFTITITPDTEITSIAMGGRQKITFVDLTDKANVTVYATNPIESTSFSAAKIDMIIPPSPAPAAPKI